MHYAYLAFLLYNRHLESLFEEMWWISKTNFCWLCDIAVYSAICKMQIKGDFINLFFINYLSMLAFALRLYLPYDFLILYFLWLLLFLFVLFVSVSVAVFPYTANEVNEHLSHYVICHCNLIQKEKETLFIVDCNWNCIIKRQLMEQIVLFWKMKEVKSIGGCGNQRHASASDLTMIDIYKPEQCVCTHSQIR